MTAIENYSPKELGDAIENYLYCPEPWINNRDVLLTMRELAKRYQELFAMKNEQLLIQALERIMKHEGQGADFSFGCDICFETALTALRLVGAR